MKKLWQENKGSISVFAGLSIIAVLMILFLSINIGNIFAKKSLVEDTADAISEIILANQVDRWILTTADITNGVSVPRNGTQTGLETGNAVTTQITATNGNDPLPGATRYPPVFGLWTEATQTFCGFGEVCMDASNNAISPTDPNLNNVTMTAGEEFAVIYQIHYDPSPLGMLSFALTLKGQSIATTGIAGLQPPDDNPTDDCCCQAAGLANETITITDRIFLVFDSCWRDIPPIETANWAGVIKPDYPIPFVNPGDEKCVRKNIFTNIFGYPGSPTCKTYSDCKGTFLEALFEGGLRQIFSRRLSLFRCWYSDFITDLKTSITTISGKVNDMWDGWQ